MRQETYDILNVGKHNRFFIRGAGGDPICVHNCGYGMSANTFKIRMELTGNHEAAGMSDTLVTAFRHKNYKIPMFWNRCNEVLEIMLAGGSIRFGGPNDDLFYADGSTEFFGVRIPTVQLPNGQYIFYQNLRKEVGDNGRMQFVYDQFKGSQSVPTRVWGSIIDENLCIAEDTLVLTDSGWKKIQDITTFDKVHDGIDFVTHGGLVFKSVKDCVKVDGVYMTKDHEVLTNDGWKTAEIHLSAGATSQLSRFDFSEVWQVDRYQGDSLDPGEVALGLPMRLWKHSKSYGVQSKGSSKQGWNTPLWLQCIGGCFTQSKLSWLYKSPYLLDMEKHESPLPKSKTQGVEKLWWQRDNRMRAMVRLPSVLRGYVTDLSARFGFRPQGQQSWVLQGELPMGYTTCELQQQTQQRSYSRWGRKLDDKTILREVQSKDFNSSISSIEWDNHATTGGATRRDKAVYDILNCGSRNRFVVKGDAAPFVVHNCQALAFVILKWQAIEIAKRGVPISLNVHDEWVSVVPRSMAAYAAKVHHDCMKATPPYIPDGLLDCEVDVGINYADLHTIDVAKVLGG